MIRRPLVMLVPVIAVILFAAVLLISRKDDVDRDSYVQRNEAIRRSLPVFPGAIRVSVEHSPDNELEGDRPGPVVGYGTAVDYRVHAGTRPKVVSAFYKRRLEDWRVVRDFRPCPSTTACPPTTTWFARDKASIVIEMDDLRPSVRDNSRGKGGRIFTVSVDHDYYGRNPPEPTLFRGR